MIDPIAADAIGDDEDIYDTMAVCKIKRGADNVKTRVKTRFVLCGNQMNKSVKRIEMRTMSPTIRSATFKSCCAVAAIEGMRHSAFDVVAAYLQGEFNGQRVVARAPRGFRTFDERGVEIVWILKRPLYGEPDAGRIWYNTFVHYVTVTDACRFQRCHYDPCAFVHKCSSESGGGRIFSLLFMLTTAEPLIRTPPCVMRSCSASPSTSPSSLTAWSSTLAWRSLFRHLTSAF